MILNKTTKHGDRYRIIDGSMGNAGLPDTAPDHKYQIAAGIDRGNGYQTYESISFFLKSEYAPAEAKENCRKFLRGKGYNL